MTFRINFTETHSEVILIRTSAVNKSSIWLHTEDLMWARCESWNKSNLFSMSIWQKTAEAAVGIADLVVILFFLFFPLHIILRATVKLKNNTDFLFIFQGKARETKQDKMKRRKTKHSGSHRAKKERTKKWKENCWQVKTSSLSWDYPHLRVQTAGREQNKARDWRDDVPFIRLCSGVGLPQCRHTPHSQPSSDNNSANTHQQIMRTRKTCNSCIHVCVRQSEVLIQLPLLKSLAFGCQNASLNRILHTFECLNKISLFYRQKSRLFCFDDFDDGCAQCILKSLVSSSDFRCC